MKIKQNEIYCSFFLYVLFFSSEDLQKFTEMADVFLKKQVDNGLVDYQGVKENSGQIDQLYQQAGTMSLDGASEKEKKAFYINAYNIIAIHQIVENYPVKSPQDIKGFFDEKRHLVAGEKLTLNALEKEKLINPYQDPRIHFVLVCAAMSCPPLADFAYRADKLDEQLDQKTQQTLNDAKFIQVMNDKKQVKISKIFDWYKSDFTEKSESVLAFINQYRKKKIPDNYKTGYYEYDWRLNAR